MLESLQITLAWIAALGVISGPIPLLAADETPAAASTEPQTPKLSDEQLDTLLAPIALYPDPLLAQILPAATVPSDVVLAARYVAAKKDPDKIDAQPWEESVKALARYPDVIKMMDEKLDWTTQLGHAFLDQPSDVFNSVQRLRAKAQAVGNLKDSPQQVVVVEKEVIKIMPADPQVIYVPTYQPDVVYVQQPVNVVAPLITFGAGLALGIWIHNELDWHDHHVYYHNYGWSGGYHGGNYHGGGNNINIDNSNNINIGNGNGNGSVWKPSRPGNGNNKPGNGNGNWPGNGSNKPGNGNGNWPGNGDNKPGNGNNKPGNGNGGWPGNGNNKPGSGNGGNKPSWPGNGNGGNKPGNGFQKPTTLPAKPGQGGQQKPTTRPAQRPSQQPGGGFSREGSKQRPADAGRPANRPAAANRGGGGGGGGNRGGGGNGGGGNRGGGGQRAQR